MIRAEDAEIAEKMTPHIDQISHDLIGVAMRLHSEIGPGLLESVYETLLARRLSMMGDKVERKGRSASFLRVSNLVKSRASICCLRAVSSSISKWSII